MSDPLEPICGNCISFFPDTFAPTENGICIADEALEPYLDDLLDYGDFSGCQVLIEVKNFIRSARPVLDMMRSKWWNCLQMLPWKIWLTIC
ncbi:MAG: hypothetical protein ACN4GW_00810 [Desulforhopalus sp.]